MLLWPQTSYRTTAKATYVIVACRRVFRRQNVGQVTDLFSAQKQNTRRGNIGTGQLARGTPGARHTSQSENIAVRYSLAVGSLACVRTPPGAEFVGFFGWGHKDARQNFRGFGTVLYRLCENILLLWRGYCSFPYVSNLCVFSPHYMK